MVAWIDTTTLSSLILLLMMAGGFFGLFFGGEALCRGSVALARLARISPLVIGLTVVSVATSMPEMFTSLFASMADKSGLVIGNIVGSNISNIGLILAIAALLSPLTVQLQIIRQEMPILVLLTILFTVLAWSGFTRWEGAFLLMILVIYLVFLIRQGRGLPPEAREQIEATRTLGLFPCLALLLVGTLLLSGGAELLVKSASEMATRMGVSDVLIGLTLVAIGTSLPELATSIAAAWHRQADICVGNLIGSNLFNILLIGGGTALFFPFSVEPGLLFFEFPVMLLLTLLLWPFVVTGRLVSRREGVILLFLFGMFLGGTVLLRWTWQIL